MAAGFCSLNLMYMKNVIFLVLGAVLAVSCSGPLQTDPNEERAVVFRDGSEEYPFVPEDFKSGGAILLKYLDSSDEVWVKGWVVGYVSGTKISAVVFGSGEGSKASNIVICGAQDGSGQLFPVQLSTSSEESKAVREQLNLLDNPDVLGCEICIKGKLADYMGTIGLKSTTSVIF